MNKEDLKNEIRKLLDYYAEEIKTDTPSEFVILDALKETRSEYLLTLFDE